MSNSVIGGTLFYFGDPWSAPALEGARRVPTPVGDPCLACSEPIIEGDRGLIQLSIRNADILTAHEVTPIHVECQALGIIGHMFGVCPCTGHDTVSRESALLLWRRVAKVSQQYWLNCANPVTADHD